MALSGSLREFSISEIVQLLSSQRKTGCLHLERAGEKACLWFEEGRLIGAREPGLGARDPLMAFLRRVRWLSKEQLRGIETLHAESGRDLVDILLNGRYVEGEELAVLYERMVLDRIHAILGWQDGRYSFDPAPPPETALPLSFSTEGLLMEAVRRVDEHRRYLRELPEAHAVPGLKELPDPDAELGEEEKEIFALVDGRRTIGEIVSQAPLCDFEAIEALANLFGNGWLEVVGAREVGGEVEETRPRRVGGVSRLGDLVVVGALAGLAVALIGLAAPLRRPPAPLPVPPGQDVYQRARWHDLEMAIEVYRREKGAVPERLEELVASEWLTAGQLRFPGYRIEYRPAADRRSFRLDAVPLRPR